MKKSYICSIFALVLIFGIFISGKIPTFAACATWDSECQIAKKGGNTLSINEYYQLNPPPNWVKDPISGKWGAPSETPTLAVPPATNTETPTLAVPIINDEKTYQDYLEGSRKYCDSDKRPWNTGSTLVPEIDYPAFSTDAVNAAIRTWRDGVNTINPDEKLRLQRDLDPVTIGEYSGFKTLEVARVAYRTRMNSLFACGIIGSRIDTVKNLKELIAKKIKNLDSEIYQKLKKDIDKLEKSRNELKCNIEKDDGKKEEMVTDIINSSSHQYCHYRHYLSYLESNVTDVITAQSIEQKIGQGEGTQISSNTSDWVSSSTRYSSDIAREIIRADTTLPKAIRSWIEMDQTYGVHVLLTLIYDDYIRLRRTLSNYMNISSQLYQKVNNAQILPQ